MNLTSRRGHLFAVAAAILVTTAVRLVVAAKLPLSFDEAYYWRWSQELSLSYPDHPPLVAWLIHLGTAIAGNSELGVRLWFVLLSGLGMALIYRIARTLDLSRPKAAVAMLTAAFLPAVAVGSLLATPDLPLGICALGTVWLLLEMAREKAWSWNPVLLAITVVLGFYAKLAAGLLVLTVGVVAAAVPAVRKALLSSRGAIAALLLILLVTPLAVADLYSDRSATLFQLARLDPASLQIGWAPLIQRTLTHLGEVVGGQLGLLTPFIALLAVIAWSVRPRKPSTSILSVAWWLPIVVTCCAALFTHPEQNWAALGHPFAAVLAVWVIAADLPPSASRSGFLQRHRHKFLAATLAGVLFPTVLIHIHALTPVLPLPPGKDPIGKLRGYESLGALPQLVRESAPVETIFADNYGLASQAAWALRDQPFQVSSCDRPAGGLPAKGTWLLLDELDDLSHLTLPASCRSTRPLRTLQMRDPAGRILRSVRVSLGFGCKYRCER